MRTTILFFLSLAILTLTSVGWYMNLSKLDSRHSPENRKLRHEQIDKIRAERDIDKLRNKAVDLALGFDELNMERDRGVVKAQSFLFLAMFLSAIALILTFQEVAAKGRALMEKTKVK